jgi:26S proteasome regulatory subunit N9
MANTVKEKVALVCTMELASQRSAAERSITFTELAGATRLPLEQIEWLLMRAMSLGLIRGSIDEVDQIIHISYIKVRCFLQLDLTRSYL